MVTTEDDDAVPPSTPRATAEEDGVAREEGIEAERWSVARTGTEEEDGVVPTTAGAEEGCRCPVAEGTAPVKGGGPGGAPRSLGEFDNVAAEHVGIHGGCLLDIAELVRKASHYLDAEFLALVPVFRTALSSLRKSQSASKHLASNLYKSNSNHRP